MNIAIIPARGGSKRIPRKNVKLFYGKPMIAYSIETALQSGCFDKVIVSTDDQEIANIAKQYGAEIPFMRPTQISDDHATTIDVIHHAVTWYESQNINIDNVCCLYATAPFVCQNDLQQGLTLLSQEGVEFTFSATEFPFPIQRAIKIAKNGEISMFNPENALVRSQDLAPAFHDAGQFYWGKKQAFLEKKAIFAPHSRAVLLPRIRVQDIDTPEDWEMAEYLYQVQQKVRK